MIVTSPVSTSESRCIGFWSFETSSPKFRDSSISDHRNSQLSFNSQRLLIVFGKDEDVMTLNNFCLSRLSILSIDWFDSLFTSVSFGISESWISNLWFTSASEHLNLGWLKFVIVQASPSVFWLLPSLPSFSQLFCWSRSIVTSNYWKFILNNEQFRKFCLIIQILNFGKVKI